MKDTITLGEMKARCAEMSAKHGTDHCCDHCEYADMGCCDPPDTWKLEAGCVQPNWEEMFHKSEETCRQMYMKMEDAERRADRADEEIRRLRLIVSTVETMIGRKFEV